MQSIMAIQAPKDKYVFPTNTNCAFITARETDLVTGLWNLQWEGHTTHK